MQKKTFTFDTFVDGDANKLTKKMTFDIINADGLAFNPLFIHGDTGVGKTHLLRAISNLALHDDRNKKIRYVCAESFVREMCDALKNKKMFDFKKNYRSLDVLLVDEIQFFSGKPYFQEEFFHTFNELINRNKQIVLTSSLHPMKIFGLEEKLLSRFSAGLVLKLDLPGFETRVSILKQKSHYMEVDLSDEIISYMAEHLTCSPGGLEGAINIIYARASSKRGLITLKLVQESLQDMIKSHSISYSIDYIQKVVAHYYGIPVSSLVSNSRSHSIVRPRQMAMSLIRELTLHTASEIGRLFGDRDHTTVLHACRTILHLRNTQKESRQIYEDLREELKH